jgi:hypothetical protein
MNLRPSFSSKSRDRNDAVFTNEVETNPLSRPTFTLSAAYLTVLTRSSISSTAGFNNSNTPLAIASLFFVSTEPVLPRVRPEADGSVCGSAIFDIKQVNSLPCLWKSKVEVDALFQCKLNNLTFLNIRVSLLLLIKKNNKCICQKNSQTQSNQAVRKRESYWKNRKRQVSSRKVGVS